MKKQVTILSGIDLRRRVNAQCVSCDMDFKDVCSFFPDFIGSWGLEALFDQAAVKHIAICLYTNKAGEGKRRIVGLGNNAREEELKSVINGLARSLGVDIDRSLEILKGGK